MRFWNERKRIWVWGDGIISNRQPVKTRFGKCCHCFHTFHTRTINHWGTSWLPWAECMCSSWVKAETKVRHVLVICCTFCCCPLTPSCQLFLGLLLVAIVTVQLIGLSCHCTHGNVRNACSEVLPGFTAPLQYESLWGYPNWPPDLEVSQLLPRRKAQFSSEPGNYKSLHVHKGDLWIFIFLWLKPTKMRIDKLDKVEINPLLCCVLSRYDTLLLYSQASQHANLPKSSAFNYCAAVKTIKWQPGLVEVRL